MNRRFVHLSLGSLLLAAGLAACSSTRYTDPEKRETFNVEYGRTDLQRFASDSVDSLNDSPRLAAYQPRSSELMRPVKMYMGSIQNRTGEHIDTSGIRDKIQVALVNTEPRRFTILADPSGQLEIGDQLRFQHESGRVDPAQAREIGRQLGAELVLYGALRAIDKKSGRSIESLGSKSEDVYYQFTLNVVDIESGEIVWANEVEISKRERVSLFGGG